MWWQIGHSKFQAGLSGIQATIIQTWQMPANDYVTGGAPFVYDRIAMRFLHIFCSE